MFALACLLGTYSYGIFALGILDILTHTNIAAFTFAWLIVFIIYFIKFRNYLKFRISSLEFIGKLSLLLITLQLLVNLIGTLGPELGFDALWYHLTQPKIWLQQELLRFIPGPIFRYSVTPQLTETLYAAALVFGSEIWAKLIHYSFGILCLLVTFKLARKFLTPDYSLLATLLLSSNLVFSWQQTTAYVDLARTFFESLALLLFLEDKYTASAITLGLAVCSKLVSLASLPIYIILLIINKSNLTSLIRFTFYLLLIPLPWLLLAYLHTGNPIYPIGSLDLAMPVSWHPADLWTLFTHSADPISPIYIITAPLIFFINRKNWSRGLLIISAYCLMAIIVWFIFPHTGGSRYFLPYLPALSVLTAIIIFRQPDLFIKKFLIHISLFISLTSIGYRAAANWKYLPVLLGRQSAADFLSRNLNFSFGDYFDTDSYLQLNIPPSAGIYPAGINNLYYLTYNLVLPPKTITAADYLLIRYPDAGFSPGQNWQQIHTNFQTKTSLYVQN